MRLDAPVLVKCPECGNAFWFPCESEVFYRYRELPEPHPDQILIPLAAANYCNTCKDYTSHADGICTVCAKGEAIPLLGDREELTEEQEQALKKTGMFYELFPNRP